MEDMTPSCTRCLRDQSCGSKDQNRSQNEGEEGQDTAIRGWRLHLDRLVNGGAHRVHFNLSFLFPVGGCLLLKCFEDTHATTPRSSYYVRRFLDCLLRRKSQKAIDEQILSNRLEATGLKR